VVSRNLSPSDVEAFLVGWHGRPIAGLEALSGGFWSTAFAYTVDSDAFVVRFGSDPAPFEADRRAMAFNGRDLPVPVVLDVGAAFGGAYAISVRHRGRFLETVRPDEARAAGPAVLRLLGAMHAIAPEIAAQAVGDTQPPGGDSAWRRWLLASLVDDPGAVVHGWRSKLAREPDMDRLFRACDARIRQLADACPERRDLLHGDLLHGNVLISEDAARITGVFSWKCAQRGDFLFDVAWCTFWGAYHGGIGATDMWGRVLGAWWAREPGVLIDAALRHHCYELQIGVSHLAWNVWTGDEVGLRWVARHTAKLLERGSLTAEGLRSVREDKRPE
jgi:aminoglycoside phosphotransferase (APT) family kinase protein